MSDAVSPIVTTRQLGRRFAQRWAVRGVDLDVKRGEMIGVVGATTLLQMFAAILDPTEGKCRVLGCDARRDAKLIAARLGYMTQGFTLYDRLSVDEDLVLAARLSGVDMQTTYPGRRKRLLDMAHLERFTARPAAALSGGMRKKLSLCTKLVHQPELLILDEPGLGVDPVSRRQLWQMLEQFRERGITVLTATSYMDEAERCDRVVLLDSGRVLSIDTPANLRKSVEGRVFEVVGPEPMRTAAGLEVGTHAIQVQILLDGTNSNVAENARRYASAIVERFAAERQPLRVAPAAIGSVPITRIWYNPDQETALFMVLSMFGLAAMLVGAICPAASIVRERERGTIEQLLVTPIRIGEVFVAKTLPTLVINLLAIAPALVVTRIFDVPIRGSLATFVVLAAVFQLSAIAFGVFIASITRTLQQALLLAFFGLFPILFLSGTLTPIESMPPLLQTASLVSPVRYFMETILGVFLKGAGWAELWPKVLILAIIGGALFALSLIAFRRRVS